MSFRGFAGPALLLLAIPLSAARLGDRVTPERYVLQLTPDLSRETFAGEESIDLQIGEPVTMLRLHAVDLAISAVTLRAGQETIALTVSTEPADETVLLSAGRLIPAGPARLQLHFEGKLNRELRGFYVSRTEKRKYAVTQFEATDARRAFPCFDEPSFKAVYEISLVIDSRDSAISNAQMISDTSVRRGKHTVRFAPTPPISSYLVAMLVGDFRCLKGTSDDIPIRVCTTPGQERLARFALDTAQAVLHYDNVYFGIRYPFAKLDLIGIPDFQAGAMENAGAITFRESFLLLDDATASTEDRKLVAGVIAHEIAHMWFGDLVTMKWWDDIWLNEGFATLMTRRPLEAWHPEWRLDLDAVNQTLTALATDSRQSTRPIRTHVETPREIFSLFDGIAYGKTASVLGMIEEWLGPEVFRKSINRYLARYAWNNASAEDFWTSMAQSSGQPVDAVMRSFVEQPGAPLLHVTERCEAGRRVLEVSQERLAPAGQKNNPAPGWTIPVCLRASANDEGLCTMVTPSTTSITLPSCAEALLWNRNGAGYYLAEHFTKPRAGRDDSLRQLSEPERLSLHGSEWLLVRDLREGAGDYLDLVRALAQSLPIQSDGALLAALVGNLHFLDDRLVNASNRSRWQQRVRKDLGGMVSHRWEVAGEDPEKRARRAMILSLLGGIGGDSEVVAGARELAVRFVRDPGSVDPVVAPQALRVAATFGDGAMFDAIMARLDGPAGGAPREQSRSMLTSFQDPAVLTKVIEYAFGEKVRPADVRALIAGLMANPAARPAAWRAMKSHWPELQRKIPAGVPALIGSTALFCDVASRNDVQTFFSQHPGEGIGEQLPPALAAIDACIAFRAAQQASFDRALPRDEITR